MPLVRRLCPLLLLVGAACDRSFGGPPTQSTPPALALTASPSVVAPLGQAKLAVANGTPAFQFAFADRQSGLEASLDLDGTYHAGRTGGVVDRLLVTDAAGKTATVSVTVTTALALDPPVATAAPRQPLTFRVGGGQAPYALHVTPGCAADPAQVTMDGDQGRYLAGSCGDVADLLWATDANQAISNKVQVTVHAAVLLFPQAAHVSPGQALTFAASGGAPPYAVSFAPHGNESGGSVDPAGQYLAGPNADTRDRVQVTDSLGSVALAEVAVGGPIVQLPVQAGARLFRGDFNGDFVDDLVAIQVGPPATVQMLFGSPTGFVSGPSLVLDQPFEDAVVADFDGDGRSDLVLAEGPYVEVLHVLAGGTLELAARTQFSDLDYRVRLGAVPLPSPDGGVYAVAAVPLPVPNGFPPAELQFLADPRGPLGHGTGALEEVGAFALPSADAQLGGDPGVSSLAVVNQGLIAACDAAGDRTAWQVLSVAQLADGGVAAHAGLTGCTSLCDRRDAPQSCRYFTGLVSLGPPGEPAGAQEAFYAATVRDFAPGQLELRPLQGGTPPSVALPPGVDLAVEPAQLLNGRYVSGRFDLVGTLAGEQLGWVDGGGLAPTGTTFPEGLVSSVSGLFEGYPDRAVAVADTEGRVRLLMPSPGGAVGDGNRFRYPGPFYGGAQVAVEDGGWALAVAGGELTVFAGAGDGRLATEARLLPGARAQLLASSASGRLLAADVEPGVALGLFAPELVDGGWQAPGWPLPALDAPATDLLVSGSGASEVWAVLAYDQASQQLSARAFTFADGPTSLGPVLQLPDAEPGGALVELPNQPGPALAVRDDSGAVPTLVLKAPATGGGWSANNLLSITGDQASGQAGCGSLFEAVTAFSLHPGGPADHVAGLANAEGGPDSCHGILMFFMDATTGVVGRDLTRLRVIEPEAHITPVDLDGDGNTDLVLYGAVIRDPTAVYDPPLMVMVAWGDGTGGFTLTTFELPPGSASLTTATVPYDVDGDGLPDLVVVRLQQDVVSVLHNAGQRQFHW